MVWNISLASSGQLSWLCSPPPSFLCNSLLAEHETQRRPRKHHMTDGLVVATNIILTLNPKPSPVLATERKINSIPSKTRTVSEAPAHGE